MVNILIPMAGLGSRFSQAGFINPKPFIDVAGLPMIVRVLDNLKIDDSRFILILQKTFMEDFRAELSEIKSKFNVEFIAINMVTEGAACTALFAIDYINNSSPLLIANSDQLVDLSILEFIEDANVRNLDGSILVFESNEPKWSYVKTDDKGYMTLLKEKSVISENATVGIYYFSKGSDFVLAATKLIINNDRVNNEFYVAPTYNYLVSEYQKKIGIYTIEKTRMHGLGTPEDLRKYLRNYEKK